MKGVWKKKGKVFYIILLCLTSNDPFQNSAYSFQLDDHFICGDHCAFMPIIGIDQRGPGYPDSSPASTETCSHSSTYFKHIWTKFVWQVFGVFCLLKTSTIVWVCHLKPCSMIRCFLLLRIVRILSQITITYITKDTVPCYSRV